MMRLVDYSLQYIYIEYPYLSMLVWMMTIKRSYTSSIYPSIQVFVSVCIRSRHHTLALDAYLENTHVQTRDWRIQFC